MPDKNINVNALIKSTFYVNALDISLKLYYAAQETMGLR